MFVKAIRRLFRDVKGSSSRAGAFWCCVLILLLVPVRTAVAQTAAQFETPPTLRAQELAPATLLKGNGFSKQPT